MKNSFTQLLIAYGEGKKEILDEMLPLVYEELHRLAENYLRRERVNHTLQPTALVNEAYLRLVDQKNADWKNRSQFIGLAAQMMRRILVNHAIAHRAGKRGGENGQIIPLDEVINVFAAQKIDLVNLNEALERLHDLDEQKAKIVELKFFGGMTIDEISHTINVSTATVEREWHFSRAWLKRELSQT